MQDLQEVTHEIHYENYRSEKLQPRKQLRTNEIDTDEQQKKLIKEKDDEVIERIFFKEKIEFFEF
jgi:septin family protein